MKSSGGEVMVERKILRGWKKICRCMGLCREHMLKYGYPVHNCDKAVHHGYGVCAYADELDAHRAQLERIGREKEERG